jgi:hypothetical protein
MNGIVYQFLCLLFVLAISSTDLFAQAQPKVYRLKNIDEASVVIPYAERYQYEQFRRGTVYRLVGGLSEALLNYNYLLGEVQFLGPQNDTLSIDHVKSRVKFAAIGDDLFYFQQGTGYIKIIGDYNGIKLGIRDGFVSLGNDKSIGYGQYISTGATDNYRSYTGSSGATANLDKKTAMVVTRRTSLFIMDKNDRIYPATKASMLKVYSKIKKEVNAYLKDHEVNFAHETEVRAFLDYCRKVEDGLN